MFDLDGTIVDSRIDITEAINYAVRDYGLGPYSVEEISSMVGRGITRLIEDLMRPHPHVPVEDIKERFLFYYERHLTDNTRPYPGVKDVLEELRDYKKAVVSNKREYLSKKTLEELGLLEYFDLVMGSDSAPQKKPSPDPLLIVLKRFNIPADEAVMVGDSDLDIMAGRGAGVKTIAVSYGYRPREVLSDADFIIDNIRDLPPLIKRLEK